MLQRSAAFGAKIHVLPRDQYAGARGTGALVAGCVWDADRSPPRKIAPSCPLRRLHLRAQIVRLCLQYLRVVELRLWDLSIAQAGPAGTGHAGLRARLCDGQPNSSTIAKYTSQTIYPSYL